MCVSELLASQSKSKCLCFDFDSSMTVTVRLNTHHIYFKINSCKY